VHSRYKVVLMVHIGLYVVILSNCETGNVMTIILIIIAVIRMATLLLLLLLLLLYN